VHDSFHFNSYESEIQFMFHKSTKDWGLWNLQDIVYTSLCNGHYGC